MHPGLRINKCRKNSPETNSHYSDLEPAGNRCEQCAKLPTDTSIQRWRQEQHEQQPKLQDALYVVGPDSVNKVDSRSD